MDYVIRHRDGQVVATHSGDLRGLDFPAAETVEQFEDRSAFEARSRPVE